MEDRLARICDAIRSRLDGKDAARERGLELSREVIRRSANAIRAAHRGEFAEAEQLLAETLDMVRGVEDTLRAHPDVHYAGFAQDAQKEFAEARLTLALVQGRPLPAPDELQVDDIPYLGGLSEAVGELRRAVLDRIRLGRAQEAESLLAVMDDIYAQLVSFDYPSAVTGNLKRSTDVARSIIEKTRGDLTNALRQQCLEGELRRLEEGLQRSTRLQGG